MDFNDTPDEAQFRDEVRTFLAKHGKLKGPGNNVAIASPDLKPEALTAVRAWQRIKCDAGYAAITWPEEVGGRGGTVMQQVIYGQEEAKFDVPPSAPFAV